MKSTNEKIVIVIVEDDKSQREMYNDCIEEYNLENKSYEIVVHLLNNDNEIPSILYNNHIDAIIIDLNWGVGDAENKGNNLIKKIYKDCRIPIFVISGNLQYLENDYKESPIFKKYQRDDIEFDSVLDEIEALYKTGYTRVLGSHSKIDQMLSKVFWDYMSDSIDYWKDQEESLMTQRMLRFATTRINEMLTIDSSHNHDNYDSLEFYIKPAIKDKPFTGDIIIFDDKKYIVITAACDLEQDNSEYVVLCQISFNIIDDLKTGIKGGSNTAERDLEKYINNSKARFHLLPPCNAFTGGLIDFQILVSVEKSDFFEHSVVIAAINPSFVKDIQARFSHYYGRQGQPQLNKSNIIDFIKNY